MHVAADMVVVDVIAGFDDVSKNEVVVIGKCVVEGVLVHVDTKDDLPAKR
jgi:hypothetical protein